MEFFNFGLYLLLMVYAWKFHRQNLFLLYIVLIWFTSSFLGVFYINIETYRKGLHQVEMFPFIYLFVCFLILLYPLLRQKQQVKYILYGNDSFLDFLSMSIGLISLFPFAELVYKFYESILSGEFFILGSMYDDVAVGYAEALIKLSPVGSYLKEFCGMFCVVSPVLLFYYLIHYPTKKAIIIGLFISSFILPLDNLRIGGKTQMIFFFLYFLGLFLFLMKALNAETKKNTLKFISLIGGVAFGCILILTISRYYMTERVRSASESSNFLFQYSAESMYNFNQNAFYEEKPLAGYYTMNPLLDLMGISEIKHQHGVPFLMSRREYLSNKIKSSPSLFYSLIGDVYFDFGRYYTIPFLMVIALILSLSISKFRRRAQFRLPVIMIISLYIYILSCSLFYFCFKMTYRPIYFTIFFAIMIQFFDSKTANLNQKTKK